MSARSPRGSISAASNVAEDFEESLKDLQQNNRYEISNLTLIAKESTESAQAISKALENHIRTTAPTRKLPALYVLDSIVKNVGTPYTVYLGRNLYSTFMDAYLLVDSNTRRSMEGMLKTWKEHVPGSLDPRPVFPPETVRPIENALLKAKSLQNQRQPYQQTQTPPQHHGQFAPPLAQHQYPNAHHQVSSSRYIDTGSKSNADQPTPFPPQPYQTPTPLQQFQVPGPHGLVPQGNNVESIKNDLTALISRMQGQFAANPQDATLRTKLQALLQLQEVMRSQAHALRDTELEQIRAQISQLSNTPQPSATPTPQWQPPVPQPYVNTPPQFLSPQKPPPQAQPNLASLLAPGALDGLQALLSGGQKPSTPQMRSAVPALQNASHSQLNHVQNHVNAAPSMNSTDLLAALSKSNLLPPLPVSTPLQAAAIPASAPVANAGSTEALLASIKSFLPTPSQNTTPMQAQQGKPHIPMNATSLKTFRPELVRALYDTQPNQCTNCGRRFLADEDGRAKKARHLDWHFRTNQRMADSNTNRGHHRNWFVDEMEWIRLVDFDPSTTTAEDASQLQAKKTKQDVSEQWVRAQPGQTKNTCSICYEEMRTTYSEETHDWVFANAVQYAPGKIVHATCAEEIKKSSTIMPSATGGSGSLAAALASVSGGRRSRSATPDSTLGKRKAENTLAGVGAQRVKME